MENKKTFFGMDYEETGVHKNLSEFLEMISWGAQHNFPENFGGLFSWFSKPKGTYGVDYFWINNFGSSENSFEMNFKNIVHSQLDKIRNSVDAIGWLDQGQILTRPDYTNLDRTEKMVKKFYPDKNLVEQVKNAFLNEMFVNQNDLTPNNIFYYKLSDNLHRHSKTWLETISLGYEQAKSQLEILNNSFHSRVLALEGIKSLEKEIV